MTAEVAEQKPEKVEEVSNGGATEATEAETISPVERKIMRQVEYYFGDSNLNRDKFLLDQIAKDSDGWVPISVLLTFKRLASLSTDAAVIAEACAKSDEGLVEVSEDKSKIRRHPERPMPEHNEERRKDISSRTAYAKGFPLDSTMDELLEYFAGFEKVVHINMRKYLDKPTKTYKFKGSVFATFEKKEQTENFIEKANPKYKDTPLIVKWQEKYIEEKREEQKAKANKKKEKKEKEEENTITLAKGSVLFFEGATEAVTRELIKEAVGKVSSDWDIAYVDFSRGNKDGHVRFHEEGSAEKYLEKLEDKKLKINDDVSLDLRTLSEEEEKEFLAKAVENMKNRRSHFNQKKGGFNRKRRSGNHNERNDEKKAKSDD
ncbi:la protein homolog [Stomoxys calcitrans]|uniref:la protein homolog n=1 Tax=Stomoxys calcitrans TaxID=35570 RepID=UPI0027E26C5A|nr:la protein homolog [Stomoxys calcitrans]